MEIIIITAVIVIAIILYGLYRLRKLRKKFEEETQKTVVQFSHLENIPRGCKDQILYKKSKSRILIITVISAILVSFLGFAFYWYDTHKETWAKEAEQRRIEKAEEIQKKGEAQKRKEEQEFQAWKAKMIAKAQKEANEAFAAYQESHELYRKNQNLQEQEQLISDSLRLNQIQKREATRLLENLQHNFKQSYAKSTDSSKRKSLTAEYQKQVENFSTKIINLDNQEKQLSEKIKDIQYKIRILGIYNIERYEKIWQEANLAIAAAQNLTIDDKIAADEREIVFIVFRIIFGILLVCCIGGLIWTCYY